jgi:hypothetical protein
VDTSCDTLEGGYQSWDIGAWGISHDTLKGGYQSWDLEEWVPVMGHWSVGTSHERFLGWGTSHDTLLGGQKSLDIGTWVPLITLGRVGTTVRMTLDGGYHCQKTLDGGYHCQKTLDGGNHLLQFGVWGPVMRQWNFRLAHEIRVHRFSRVMWLAHAVHVRSSSRVSGGWTMQYMSAARQGFQWVGQCNTCPQLVKGFSGLDDAVHVQSLSGVSVGWTMQYMSTAS